MAEKLVLCFSQHEASFDKRETKKNKDLKDILRQSIVDLSSQMDCLFYCLLRRGATICKSASS